MVASFISCIIPIVMECVTLSTVNSEIFARILFSRNFAYAEFRENKPSQNSENSLSLSNEGKSYQGREFLPGKYAF